MRLTELERKILLEIQRGLPFDRHPYRVIAKKVGCSEADVLEYIEALRDERVISRFGLIVRHRNLGYQHNAMVVWDIPDGKVDDIARKMSEIRCINLCYRRPRVPPDWPYNLFCMIHAKNRDFVHDALTEIKADLEINEYPCAILFSEKAYKQTAAKYV